MKKRWYVLMTLILALMASGCAAAPSKREPVSATMVVEREVAYAPAAEEGGRYAVADVSQALTVETQERMVIYTLNMELVVEDTAGTLAQIESLAKETGGFVSDSNSWKEEGQLRARITIRVPADKLDQALAQIRDLAADVQSEVRDSEDVTEEFTDLEARLRNLRKTEEELLELLETRQEETGDTEAILEVHRYLTDIRGQIEQIQGRMNYLSNLSAMATIHVSLTPDVLAQPVVVGKWRPQGTALRAIQALINTLKVLVDAFIWIVIYVVPVLIVILLPLFLVVRAIIRWRRKRRPPSA
jgi:acetolactate synthase small subunit